MADELEVRTYTPGFGQNFVAPVGGVQRGVVLKEGESKANFKGRTSENTHFIRARLSKLIADVDVFVQTRVSCG